MDAFYVIIIIFLYTAWLCFYYFTSNVVINVFDFIFGKVKSLLTEYSK